MEHRSSLLAKHGSAAVPHARLLQPTPFTPRPCPASRTVAPRLVVEEDDRALTMDFQLDPEGGPGGAPARLLGRLWSSAFAGRMGGGV